MTTARRFGAPEWLIAFGCIYFIFVLAASAAFIPEIRGLHAVQAAIYLVALVLSLRRQLWGYLIGASAALFWDFGITFGSPLFSELFDHPTQPDLLLQGIAAFANLAIIVGSIMGYRRLASRSNRDLAWLVVAFVLTNGILVGATALLAPSYLSHLAGMLHPHWPWQRS